MIDDRYSTHVQEQQTVDSRTPKVKIVNIIYVLNYCSYKGPQVEANETTAEVGWLGMYSIATAAGRQQADCRQISYSTCQLISDTW